MPSTIRIEQEQLVLVDKSHPLWSQYFGPWLKDWTEEPQSVWGWTAAKIAEHAGFDQVQAWGWSSGGELMALVLGRRTEGLLEIDFLATLPKARRQGAMGCLLQAVTSDQGIHEVWLEVHENNQPAVDLYHKLGMCEVGRRPRYYADGGACRVFSLKK